MWKSLFGSMCAIWFYSLLIYLIRACCRNWFGIIFCFDTRSFDNASFSLSFTPSETSCACKQSHINSSQHKQRSDSSPTSTRAPRFRKHELVRRRFNGIFRVNGKMRPGFKQMFRWSFRFFVSFHTQSYFWRTSPHYYCVLCSTQFVSVDYYAITHFYTTFTFRCHRVMQRRLLMSIN